MLLKVGITEFLWQIGGREENELVEGFRGIVFTHFIVIHNFLFTKGGWRHLGKLLDRYQTAQSHPCFIDSEGFYDMFKDRTKAKSYRHLVYIPDDIIRNEFSL